MYNIIDVSHQRGLYNVMVSVELSVADKILGIDSAKKANQLALELKSKYENEGHNFQEVNLWED